MKTNNPALRRTVLIIFIAICIALCLFVRLKQISFLTNAGENPYASVTDPAVYVVDPEAGEEIYIPLNGTWEYYPNAFFYSEEEPKKADSSDRTYITLPHDSFALSPNHPAASGRGSYRILLQEVPYLGRDNLAVYLSNLSADYAIYVNGVKQHQMLNAPTGYQIYLVNATDLVEIVIEVYHSMAGLNVVPVFSYVTFPMFTSDTTRNFALLVSALFLVIFIMFNIFFSSPLDRKMRPIFLYGLLLSITFIFNMLWSYGYLEVITSVLPLSLVAPIITTLELSLLALTFWLFHREFPTIWSGKCFRVACILLTASWVLYLLSGVIAAGGLLYTISFLLILACAALWVFLILYTPKLYAYSHILALVLTCVWTAIILNMLQWSVSLWLQMFYALPIGIGIYLIFSFHRYSRYKQEQMYKTLDILEMEKEMSRTQTAMLASQIQPHFLYNTLLTIQHLCETEPRKASELIVYFSNYLRHNIDFMNYTELQPFTSELEHIDNFIYIQKARFGEKLQFVRKVDFQDFQIPPLSIQPIVENAIKYGIRGSQKGGCVSLQVWKDSQWIHIVISNDVGPSFDPDHAELRSLKNIRTRLKSLLDADMLFYPHTVSDNSALQNDTKNSGTDVEIRIPLTN